MSIPKWFWVYIKNWACSKKLSMLKPNFEKADGLGINCDRKTALNSLLTKFFVKSLHSYPSNLAPKFLFARFCRTEKLVAINLQTLFGALIFQNHKQINNQIRNFRIFETRKMSSNWTLMPDDLSWRWVAEIKIFSEIFDTMGQFFFCQSVEGHFYFIWAPPVKRKGR